mmetsp:Transcript_19130/g.22852  ORF Transcript_19130/g.22852 Transcript_19130/m.22852 type:complete len:637 (+) Transcript_19130:284-2194(+)|eukprot:CAMPEP_0197844628 /NCGR_PEP_ID=MMETSP1438-20131217/1629_1 /TAXON_ID=1461541 /ORGANISM="Pterosperma sp., Strain CCMP1384" /LENGTH=636 /DNA_ID=CAMNT_0043455543 /DNA_START=281 /DNA_END=2191 /DNA_ORIENTATION=+
MSLRFLLAVAFVFVLSTSLAEAVSKKQKKEDLPPFMFENTNIEGDLTFSERQQALKFEAANNRESQDEKRNRARIETSDTRERETRKVGMIGGGLTGAIAAHFLADVDIPEEHRDLRIYVADKNARTGGMSAQSAMVEGHPYDVGLAAPVTEYDVQMLDLIKEQGLHAEAIDSKIGFFNGEEFVFKSSSNPWVNRAKLFMRYGMAAEKVRSHVLSYAEKMKNVKEMQDDGNVYIHPFHLLHKLDLEELYRSKFGGFMKKEVNDKKAWMKIRDEIIAPMIRGSIRQGTDVNSLAALSSLIPLFAKTYKIKEGIQRFSERLLDNPKVVFMGEHRVTDVPIAFVKTDENTGGLTVSLWFNDIDGNGGLDNADFMFDYKEKDTGKLPEWMQPILEDPGTPEYVKMQSIYKAVISNVVYDRLDFGLFGELDELGTQGGYARIKDDDFGGWGIWRHNRHGGVFSSVFPEESVKVTLVKGVLRKSTFGNDPDLASLTTIYKTSTNSTADFMTIVSLEQYPDLPGSPQLYKLVGPTITKDLMIQLFDSTDFKARMFNIFEHKQPFVDVRPYKMTPDFRMRKSLYSTRAIDGYMIPNSLEWTLISARNGGTFCFEDFWTMNHGNGKRGASLQSVQHKQRIHTNDL